ncbi:calcium-binding and coiled-coil domain-containing protein 1 isoform X2 [Pleurodeles waltl]|uniref:calcium-binding and coiled-coil domain-containing protein 1 isoform X2 n=1 Tax=Pleurodeles waltl TaxID=8319 RepID=UPI003709AF63
MEESFVSADASDKALLGVVFLNVARTYIPNTKVECHYTLPPNISWSASDWIGIFKVDATSVKDYTTFVWSSTHDGSGEGNSLHCSVQFQAYYLPKAGEQQYQFRYVDCHGIVCGQSTPFTFGDLRPLDDLVTLEDDEASTDMLLVVPKATVLQHQLEESQQERNSLMRSKLQLEEEVGSLKAKVEQLEEELKTSKEDYAKLMKKYQDLSESEAAVTEERDALGRQQVDHVARILELEEGIQFVSEKVLGKEEELERMGVLIKTLQTEKEILNKRLQHEAGEKQQYQAEKEKVARLNIELLKLEKSIQDEKSQKHTLRAEQSRERDTNLVQLSEGKRELKELRSALKVMQMEKEQLREEKRELLEYVRKLEERLEKVADVKWSEVAATEEEEMASTEMTLSLTESPLPDSEDESPEDMRGHTKLSPYSLCDNRSPTKKLSSSREPVQEVVISQPAPISSQKKQVPDDSSSDSEAEDEQAAMMSPARSRGEESSLLLPRLGSAFQDMARGSSSGQTWQRIMAASDSVPVARLSSSTRRECPVCKERLSSDCSLAAFQEHVDSHFFYSAHDPFTFE